MSELYVDLGVSPAGVSGVLGGKLGESLAVKINFKNGGVAVGPPAGVYQMEVKERGQYGAEPLLRVVEFVVVDADVDYLSCDVVLDSELMRGLFTGCNAPRRLMVELVWVSDGSVGKSEDYELTLSNDVIKDLGGDALPVPPSPVLSSVVTAYDGVAIAGFAGGSLNDLLVWVAGNAGGGVDAADLVAETEARGSADGVLHGRIDNLSAVVVGHQGDTLRVESRLDGKTDQDGGDQFLFGNFLESGGWSEAHGDAAIGLANNFHAWWGDEDVIRVEFEADQGEMQFYIEAGVGKDAWYGVQESSTHHWSFGQDVSLDGFAFCSGFGLNGVNYIFTIDNATKNFKIHKPLEPSGGIGKTKVIGLHRPVAAHQTCLIQEGDGGKDGVLQIAAQNGGGVGTAIVMTGQESAGDGRHWVMQHRGVADGNRFEIGYKTTAADGENIVGSVAEILGISTDGKVEIQKLVLSGIPAADPANAGEVWNDGGNLKISLG